MGEFEKHIRIAKEKLAVTKEAFAERIIRLLAILPQRLSNSLSRRISPERVSTWVTINRAMTIPIKNIQKR